MEINGYQIRSLKAVLSDRHSRGYSFTFEAKRGGKWVPYGPDVNGSWTVRSGISHRLPRYRPEGTTEDKDTIEIGWMSLADAYERNANGVR